MEIRYESIGKRFGAVEALRELDLTTPDARFLVMLGPSGCGKTTALRIVAGLEQPSTGRVFIGDRDVTRLPPKDRDIAMVFQSYALYPHMTVRENIGYPLKIRKVARGDRERLVVRVAEALGIADFLDRRPRQLSGGQRQRVALARAIIRRPAGFLLDEPLSNLDAKLRVHMRGELKRLQADLGVTTLYVTHDQSEATTMADVVAVINAGRLEQFGPPREIYDRPQNVFVATFVGNPPMNIIDAEGAEDRILSEGHPLPVHARLAHKILEAARGRAFSIGVRPEDVTMPPPGEEGLGTEVYLVQPMDNETLVTFRTGSLQLTGRFPAEFDMAMGSRTRVGLRNERLHVFDRGTGEVLLAFRDLPVGLLSASGKVP